MQTIIYAGAALVALAAVLGAIVLADARRARIAHNSAVVSDAELFAQGAAANAGRPRTRQGKEAREQGELDRKLAEAGVALEGRAWAAIVAACALALAAALFAWTRNPVIALLALPAAYVAQGAWLSRARAKRRHLFDEQLARALPQMAASIRASLTLPRAIRTTSAYCEPPLRDELQRTAADAAYSTDVVEALSRMAARTGNEHVRKLAAAVAIQSRQGGDVAPTLDLIADSINATLACERERRTEIASTKLAKWFCALAMPAIFALMAMADASFVEFYTNEPVGWAVLAGCLAFEVAGLALSHKITAL